MIAAQDGHGGAYRRLLDEIEPWLRSYYRRRLPASVVDDAVQDVILAVHQKRHTYEPARAFTPWLGAIARYKWIDRLRALKRAPLERLDDVASVGDHETAVVSAAVLDALLASLKPAQSEVIRLVKLKGYSIEQAARQTGQSVSLVKINIHRGLARLTAAVQKEGDTRG